MRDGVLCVTMWFYGGDVVFCVLSQLAFYCEEVLLYSGVVCSLLFCCWVVDRNCCGAWMLLGHLVVRHIFF